MAMEKQEADQREEVGSNNSMDGGDRLSELPHHLLHHILSFLSQKKSVRTCVLSKSWRYLWSTSPKFQLRESYFGEGKEKFTNVLSHTLHCLHIQKLLLEEFHVCFSSMLDSESISLIETWIPIVILNLCVNNFYLSLHPENRTSFDLPSVVFESKFLQNLLLQGCNLNNTNNVMLLNHLKSLSLTHVYIEDEAFEKLMSSCPIVEFLVLDDCEGLKNIKITNKKLKGFELRWYDDCNGGEGKSIVIDDIPTLESVSFSFCCEWVHDNAFLGYLKSLSLQNVFMSENEFSNCSSKYPCLEELVLDNCYGFVDFNLSSCSIKRMTFVEMDDFKAVIDARNIVEFNFQGDMPRSISFTNYSTEKWESNVNLWLYDDSEYDAWSWLLELHKLVMGALSQSEIYLSITQYYDKENRHIQVENDKIGFYKPVEVEQVEIIQMMISYSSSYLSGFINALFCVCRPRRIKGLWNADAQPENELERKQNQVTKILCKILCKEMIRKGQEIRNSWKQDVEDIILEVFDDEEWHPARGTICWVEYCAALLPKKQNKPYELRFRLEWK